jgi:hypothetical protein
LELLQLLCHVERTAIVEQGKKIYFYTFKAQKDYQKALSELLGEELPPTYFD